MEKLVSDIFVVIPVLILAYLVGGTMSAIWVARLFGLPDPRSYGSMNPGTTNMSRSNHKFATAMTFVMDILKGSVVTSLALGLGFSLQLAYFCGMFAVIGHIYPFFHNFSGGKGAATYSGVLLAVNVLCGGMYGLVWFSILALFRNAGISSILASMMIPFVFLMVPEVSHLFFAVVLTSGLIIAVHAKNIDQISQQLFRKPNPKH